MGILKSVFRVQGPEERECRRESESLGPAEAFAPGHWFCPFDESKCNTLFLICQEFCRKYFLYLFLRPFLPIFRQILGKATCCLYRLFFIKFL